MALNAPFFNPLGYQQYTSLSSAINLSSIPPTATYAIISVEGAAIRWRDDGTDPTASVGMPVAAGASFAYGGNLARLKIIQQSASAIINVSYSAQS